MATCGHTTKNGQLYALVRATIVRDLGATGSDALCSLLDDRASSLLPRSFSFFCGISFVATCGHPRACARARSVR
eukprot:scaffold117354_cov60-Attheya_sp.AAC.1